MSHLVSVILPSYNHQNYVSIAIDSVLQQTFQDFEFLISDDCSTDDTINVIKKYKDPRIQLYRFDENQGATINHKFVIEKTTGKYVALINSDDVWAPTRLEKQVAYLESHEECGACFAWAEFIDENDNMLDIGINVFKQPNRTQAQWVQYFFTKGNCICHPSILIRKKIYEELGVYNLALRQLPDFDMWTRIVKKYPIYIFQEYLVKHRRFIHAGENTSSPKITNSIRDVMESYFILSNFFEGMPDPLFKEAFHEMFRNKNASSYTELCCEKFFLLLDGKYYMPQIPLLAAINYFMRVYDEPGIYETFKKSYNFSLKDFHDISCKVDLLGLLPKDMVVGSKNDFDVEKYIKANKAKIISTILFDKNSSLYKTLKKIYFKIKRG